MDVLHKEEDGKTVPGRHIKEWTDVLTKIDKMVRMTIAAEGKSIRSISKTGLEELAKGVPNVGHGESKITYLPSRQTASDGALLHLRENYPETFQRVLDGELTARKGMTVARKAAGIVNGNESNLSRAQSAFRKMTEEERAEFLALLPIHLTPSERRALKDMLDVELPDRSQQKSSSRSAPARRNADCQSRRRPKKAPL